jgi:imidazolonepropionase
VKADLLITDCHVATMTPASEGMSGVPYGAIEDAAILIRDGPSSGSGRAGGPAAARVAETDGLDGRWVTPGLIDCHTHLVFGGDRSGEFEQRLEGATYEEIARAGGGIVSSVKATRAASEDELYASALSGWRG